MAALATLAPLRDGPLTVVTTEVDESDYIRCQAACPTGAGDDDICGAPAVAIAFDPEFGLYHVCEEHQ